MVRRVFIFLPARLGLEMKANGSGAHQRLQTKQWMQNSNSIKTKATISGQCERNKDGISPIGDMLV